MFSDRPILLDEPGCMYPYLRTNVTLETLNGTETVYDCTTVTYGSFVQHALVPVQAVVRHTHTFYAHNYHCILI